MLVLNVITEGFHNLTYHTASYHLSPTQETEHLRVNFIQNLHSITNRWLMISVSSRFWQKHMELQDKFPDALSNHSEKVVTYQITFVFCLVALQLCSPEQLSTNISTLAHMHPSYIFTNQNTLQWWTNKGRFRKNKN